MDKKDILEMINIFLRPEYEKSIKSRSTVRSISNAQRQMGFGSVGCVKISITTLPDIERLRWIHRRDKKDIPQLYTMLSQKFEKIIEKYNVEEEKRMYCRFTNSDELLRNDVSDPHLEYKYFIPLSEIFKVFDKVCLHYGPLPLNPHYCSTVNELEEVAGDDILEIALNFHKKPDFVSLNAIMSNNEY